MEGAGRSLEALLLQEAPLEHVLSETRTSADARTSSRVLHLHALPPNPSRVHWSPDTVDNEGLGKKKSNVCCIFHRERDDCCQEEGSEDDSTGGGGKDHGWNAYEQQPKCDRGRQKSPAPTNLNDSSAGAST